MPTAIFVKAAVGMGVRLIGFRPFFSLAGTLAEMAASPQARLRLSRRPR